MLIKYKIIKPIFDLFFSIFFLLICSPIYFIVFILIYTKLGSPVMFVQMRPGMHGKPFKMYKFRTMTNKTSASGQLLDDQERMTNIGTFLRKYSLDELPEFWNVIKGEMSLVGPRPLLLEYLPLYSKEQNKRHNVKPGITGWAQINGRNNLSWEEKLSMDVWYSSNYSFFLDIKILLLTVLRVVSARDISFKGMATTNKFKGHNDK